MPRDTPFLAHLGHYQVLSTSNFPAGNCDYKYYYIVWLVERLNNGLGIVKWDSAEKYLIIEI